MRGSANIPKSREVSVDAGEAQLAGELGVPEEAQGLVLFVHGSGSSRHSPRNRYVAQELRSGGLGTLLFDLLTPEEELSERRTRHLRFDIELLARRIVAATHWLRTIERARWLNYGYFGASTGAAAALMAAAQIPEAVKAIVSRGGRPDLAGGALSRVQAPTLLIVGAEDREVLDLNQRAFEQLQAPKDLMTIPGATHLFEEPGTLEQVAWLAQQWFVRHLANVPRERYAPLNKT